MNSDIKLMITLQGFRDNVLNAENAISKNSERIAGLADDINRIKGGESNLEKTVKEHKNDIKQMELDLSEQEGRAKKLDERKTNVHTEKELKAVESELETINTAISELEERIITMMDSLEEEEKSLHATQTERETLEKEFASETSKVEETNRKLAEAIKENNAQLISGMDDISPSNRSRFKKLVESKEGKAIAKVDGEICGNCNFKIPSHLAIESSKDDNASICTNCGRYIYKITS